MIKWYNDITSFLLDYISVSIKDSDVSNFYRYIIAFKNLLRSVEFRFCSRAIFKLKYSEISSYSLDQMLKYFLNCISYNSSQSTIKRFRFQLNGVVMFRHVIILPREY